MKQILLYFVILLCFSNLQAQSKWRAAKSPLSTPWTEKVSPENALPEYPRPQMTREKWLNLNGEWGFVLQKQGSNEIVKQGVILVPYPVESALSGIMAKVEPEHLM